MHSIHRLYPDFRIAPSDVEFNDGGQNSDVLIVNGEWVFRFPRYLHVLEWLKTETAILLGVQGYVPLDVPAPMFINLEEQAVGEAFIGYQMIPGEPLWRRTLRAIRDEETLEALAAQLAGFLNALHAVPHRQVIGCELPVSDTREECMDIYARIQDKLFVYMRPDAREWVIDHFEAFLNDIRSFAYEPVLRHGDFGPGNILFDGQTKRVRGIIDFGGSALGDPAYDFAGLLSGYGGPFLKRCSDVYTEVDSFMDRIRFYQGTFALLEALFGIENKDEQAFRAGIEEYV